MIKLNHDGGIVKWKDSKEYKGKKYTTYIIRDEETKSSYIGRKEYTDIDDTINVGDAVDIIGKNVRHRSKQNADGTWTITGFQCDIELIFKSK